MIETREAYKDLVKETTRPKVEPKIKLSGKDAEGNFVNILWESKNITNLVYRKSFDPLGRELPSMQLEWTEIYKGKLNEEAFPEKYNNLGKFMAVELSFLQHLNFFATWKNAFQTSKWADLLDSRWKDVFIQVPQEEIVFPKMILTAKPTIQGQMIKWKAQDFLSFLVSTQTKSFAKEIEFVNPIRYFLLNESANFLNSEAMLEQIQLADSNLVQFQNNNSTIETNEIVFGGETKNIIIDYAQSRNFYFDFTPKGLELKTLNGLFDYGTEETKIEGKTMFNFPEIQRTPNVSAFYFKQYKLEPKTENTYTKSPNESFNYFGTTFYKTIYDGYGKRADGEADNINFAILESDSEVEIIPYNWVSQDGTILLNLLGDVYSEDNKLYTHAQQDVISIERANFIERYFRNSSQIRFESLSNLAIETGDYILVETNLYDLHGNKLVKKGIVVDMEISYNGALKQKFLVHEVSQ